VSVATVVHEFELGSRGRTIRSSLTQFRGKTLVDVRLWVEPSPGEPLIPTRKGISVPLEYLPELREALHALGEVGA
jgi:hypothetical protein